MQEYFEFQNYSSLQKIVSACKAIKNNLQVMEGNKLTHQLIQAKYTKTNLVTTLLFATLADMYFVLCH